MKLPMTRRGFIVLTTGAGTGLVLGVIAYRTGWLNRLFTNSDPATFSPSTWIRIGKDGTVTITVAKSEMGQGVRTALPMIVADELDADWSTVRVEQAIAGAKYGSMSTGGSTSVRTSWTMLRKAGAAARLMLLTAAAHRWNVPAAECRTEHGMVMHVPTGRTISYGDLAEDAAALPVPKDPVLKDPTEFRIIGRRIPRTDTPEKVDGRAVFGIDSRTTGMYFASVARCPVFGGSVASYDDTQARTMPGVHRIVQIDRGIAVVARSTWESFEARDALTVKWNEGPSASLTSQEISQKLVEFSRHEGAVAEEAGNADTALAQAARKLAATYEVPFLAHATMEPMNCTASVEKDRCEIWVPTQNAQAVQRTAAALTGLSLDQVIVHTTLLGGGFGRRSETDFVEEAVQTSRAIGAPVQVIWTREDDMQHDFYRPVSLHALAAGFDAGGALIAFTHRVVAPSIGAQNAPERYTSGLDRGSVEGATDMPYAVPNLRIDYVMANTPVPIGYWRSVFPSQTVFALESFMDELAHAAGADPFEFRRSLMESHPKIKRVLELAAEKAGWGTPLPRGRFRGIAVSPPAFFHTPVAQVAEVSVGKSGIIRVHRVVSAIDCGIAVNPTGVEAQMESGIAYGMTAALKGKITIDHGRVAQSNFDDYPLLTIAEMPVIETYIVPSTEPPTGTGEPGLPAIAPAIANAVFAATGKRLRTLPLSL